MIYLERINSVIKNYLSNDERIEWIEQGKQTSQFVQKLTKAIFNRGNFSWQDFNAIFLTLIVSKRMGTQKKIERIRGLDLDSKVENEIIAEISDNIGCWGSGVFSFRYILQNKKDMEAVAVLLKKMIATADKSILDNTIKEFAKLNIKGLQTGVISPILYCLHPTFYPIINKPSTSALSNLIDVDFSFKLINYFEEAKHFHDFKEAHKLKDDYRDLDTLLYMHLEKRLEDNHDQIIDIDDPEYESISLPVDLEITLRKYLAQNSEIIGKELELLSEDKPILNDSKNRPDLVFRKPNENILLIETKKGKAGRKAIGQIVDYIAEAKKAYNKSTDEIEGIIICHEDHIDSSLLNALEVIPNISLKTYSFEFKLKDY